MKYICEFPNCSYETNVKSQIHNHHLIPKECGGSDARWNRVFLCPNCHSRVYIPGTSGIHGIKSENSVILIGWKQSTAGKILEYSDVNGSEVKYCIK